MVVEPTVKPRLDLCKKLITFNMHDDILFVLLEARLLCSPWAFDYQLETTIYIPKRLVDLDITQP